MQNLKKVYPRDLWEHIHQSKQISIFQFFKASILCQLSQHERVATSKGTWEIVDHDDMINLHQHQSSVTEINHINILLL